MAKHHSVLKAIFFLLNVFSLDIHWTKSHGLTSQAFIQTDGELKFMSEQIFIEGLSQDFAFDRNNNAKTSDNTSSRQREHTVLRFYPEFLDFGEQALSVARRERVTVENASPGGSISLYYIAGSSSDFHCSFFQENVIASGHNTSFDVVFLPKDASFVENTLYIQTSTGIFKYHVYGKGVLNPHRLLPVVGARIPRNGSLSAPITLYNPYSSTLQVLEVFSSDGDLHLEVSGHNSADWTVPAFRNKEIARAHFVGRQSMNHSMFIRIRTTTESIHEMLVLPIQLEVIEDESLMPFTAIVDLGLVTSCQGARTDEFVIYSARDDEFRFENISVHPLDNFPDKVLHFDAKMTSLAPKLKNAVGTVSCNADWANSIEGPWYGVIELCKKKSCPLQVPVRGTFLAGGITVNDTRFFVSSQPPFCDEVRPLIIGNRFNVTMAIYNVTVPSEYRSYLQVLGLADPAIILSQDESRAFSLKFKAPSAKIAFASNITLHTNISDFLVSVYAYRGVVEVLIGQKPVGDNYEIGHVGIEKEVQQQVTLDNTNPIDVTITKLSCKYASCTVHTATGTELGARATLQLNATSSMDLVVKFRTPANETRLSIPLSFQTHYENRTVLLECSAVRGQLLVVNKLVLDSVMPYRSNLLSVMVKSTFSVPLQVKELKMVETLPLGLLVVNKNRSAVVPANQQLTRVCDILLLYELICRDQCFSGLSMDPSLHAQWWAHLSLPPHAHHHDVYTYGTMLTRFRDAAKRNHTSTLLVSTDQAVFKLPVQVAFKYPDLVVKKNMTVTDPTHLDELDYTFELANPSHQPVVVQIVPIWHYSEPDAIIRALSERSPGLSVDVTDRHSFRLHVDNELRCVECPSIPGVQLSIIKPEQRLLVRFQFIPWKPGAVTSLFVVRNNLTVLDMIQVNGYAAMGQLTMDAADHIEDGRPVLQMNISEHHLSRYKGEQLLREMTFSFRNTGNLPVVVQRSLLNQQLCQDAGFFVMNCAQYSRVEPNHMFNVTIGYHPDYDSPVMTATLSFLYHSLNGQRTVYRSWSNYTLRTNMPLSAWKACRSRLPRPSWEPYLYYMVVIISLLAILLFPWLAYVDAKKVYHTAIKEMLGPSPLVKLDLKLNKPIDAVTTSKEKSPEPVRSKPPLKKKAPSFPSDQTHHQQQPQISAEAASDAHQRARSRVEEAVVKSEELQQAASDRRKNNSRKRNRLFQHVETDINTTSILPETVVGLSNSLDASDYLDEWDESEWVSQSRPSKSRRAPRSNEGNNGTKKEDDRETSKSVEQTTEERADAAIASDESSKSSKSSTPVERPPSVPRLFLPAEQTTLSSVVNHSVARGLPPPILATRASPRYHVAADSVMRNRPQSHPSAYFKPVTPRSTSPAVSDRSSRYGASGSERNSPLPHWDEPYMSTDNTNDLGEMANQTESFFNNEHFEPAPVHRPRQLSLFRPAGWLSPRRTPVTPTEPVRGHFHAEEQREDGYDYVNCTTPFGEASIVSSLRVPSAGGTYDPFMTESPLSPYAESFYLLESPRSQSPWTSYGSHLWAPPIRANPPLDPAPGSGRPVRRKLVENQEQDNFSMRQGALPSWTDAWKLP